MLKQRDYRELIAGTDLGTLADLTTAMVEYDRVLGY
jgi:hypothetical protein